MLRPASYQLVALTKLLNQGASGAILTTDGVGVGKTISAGYCVFWTARNERGSVMVVCPVGLVEKWQLELRDKFGLKAERITNEEEWATAKSELRHSRQGRVYVVPYSGVERVASDRFDLLVIDEIHNFRNRDTLGWQSAHQLAANCRRRLGLSATPINNETADLSNIYAILFPQYNPLVTDAVVVEGWDQRDLSLFAGTLTRFTKERLGIHFAQRRVWEVTVQYPDSYVNWVREAVEAATGKKPAKGKFPLETITYFRGAASSPVTFREMTNTGPPPIKSDPKVDALLDLLAKRPGQLIVFCQFRKTVENLSQNIVDRPTYQLTGDVPAFDRGTILKAFEQDPEGVLIMTAVGSEGLDLQFCSAVVNFDLHWNPMVLEQRIGRVDRIGQKKAAVDVFNFHVSNSIDEKVLQTIRRKLDLIQGTPLATSGVATNSRAMYLPEALEHESEEAAQFVKAIKAYQRLALDDEVVLPAIDSSYCEPKKLGASAAFGWLVKGNTASEWMASVTTSQAKLITALDGYQQLVNK